VGGTRTVARNVLKVHFINVGQADSILIQQGKNAMLIDGGTIFNATTVVDYIKAQGITKLNYVVGTHLHDDHLGGLSSVIWNFKVGKVFLPRASYMIPELIAMRIAMFFQGLIPVYPALGQTFPFGKATFTFLSKLGKYSSGMDQDTINNNSLVIKMKYGKNTFLFTADASELAEADMIAPGNGRDLRSDVMKIGHHGSSTSTTEPFLDAVNPRYAVLTASNDMWSLLPAKVVMDRFQAKKIPIYRTDESGTIILTSDGENIRFNCNPGSYKSRSYDYR